MEGVLLRGIITELNFELLFAIHTKVSLEKSAKKSFWALFPDFLDWCLAYWRLLFFPLAGFVFMFVLDCWGADRPMYSVIGRTREGRGKTVCTAGTQQPQHHNTDNSRSTE